MRPEGQDGFHDKPGRRCGFNYASHILFRWTRNLRQGRTRGNVLTPRSVRCFPPASAAGPSQPRPAPWTAAAALRGQSGGGAARRRTEGLGTRTGSAPAGGKEVPVGLVRPPKGAGGGWRGLERAGPALNPGPTSTHLTLAGPSAWGSGGDSCGNSRPALGSSEQFHPCPGHTRACTHSHSGAHTYAPRHSRNTCTHPHSHNCAHAHTHSQPRADTCVSSHVYILACRKAHTHMKHAYALTHVYTHWYPRLHTCSHTHIHPPIHPFLLPPPDLPPTPNPLIRPPTEQTDLVCLLPARVRGPGKNRSGSPLSRPVERTAPCGGWAGADGDPKGSRCGGRPLSTWQCPCPCPFLPGRVGPGPRGLVPAPDCRERLAREEAHSPRGDQQQRARSTASTAQLGGSGGRGPPPATLFSDIHFLSSLQRRIAGRWAPRCCDGTAGGACARCQHEGKLADI